MWHLWNAASKNEWRKGHTHTHARTHFHPCSSLRITAECNSILSPQLNETAKQLMEIDKPTPSSVPGPSSEPSPLGPCTPGPSPCASPSNGNVASHRRGEGKKNAKKRHSFSALSVSQRTAQLNNRHSMEISHPVLISSSDPRAAARIQVHTWLLKVMLLSNNSNANGLGLLFQSHIFNPLQHINLVIRVVNVHLFIHSHILSRKALLNAIISHPNCFKNKVIACFGCIYICCCLCVVRTRPTPVLPHLWQESWCPRRWRLLPLSCWPMPRCSCPSTCE